MGDENPIRTLGDYSKPSHEGYRNTIELPVGNNVDFLKLVDSLDLDSENRERTRLRLFQFFLHDQSSNWLEHLPAGSITIWEDLTTGPNPQPQVLGTTFEARVWDYMATHTERLERFENAIFKQREEINGRMTEMFRLLKELTTSRAPEKVLIREEAKSPVTKSVNSISLIREEEEKNDIYDVATGDDSKETNGPDMEVSVKEVKTKNRAENGAKNKPIKKPEKEEVVEAPSSRLVEYYLKHRINEKLIEGLVDNNRFNDSLSGARVGKKKGKTYNVLPRGPIYEAILKKKITKKEDTGGNFEIPCSIGGLKNVNALVD
ncbi:hypothetical protein Tco_1252629 [Tanacetum coccineum]